MTFIYTEQELIERKEFLISELQRFHRENNRVPTQLDMTTKNSYPSVGTYIYHFGSFNKAKIKAKLDIIKHRTGTLDGTETCTYCGKRADEILGHTGWRYVNNKRYCKKHGSNGREIPHYVIGNLDINSEKGLGRAGEILVVKTLKIGNEHDCNRISCGFKFDMYHEKYGKIDVKTSLLSNVSNRWFFNFLAKKEADTYICIGLSSNRKNVEHIWVVPNIGKIINKNAMAIYNTYSSLSIHKHWEVDSKPYNDMWKTMKLKTCNSMTDKSEPKVTRTWEETLKVLAELKKKYGTKQ